MGRKHFSTFFQLFWGGEVVFTVSDKGVSCNFSHQCWEEPVDIVLRCSASVNDFILVVLQNDESQRDNRWVTILMEEIHFTSQDTSQLDSSDCLRISRNVEPKLRKAHVSIEFLGESGEGATCSH